MGQRHAAPGKENDLARSATPRPPGSRLRGNNLHRGELIAAAFGLDAGSLPPGLTASPGAARPRKRRQCGAWNSYPAPSKTSMRPSRSMSIDCVRRPRDQHRERREKRRLLLPANRRPAPHRAARRGASPAGPPRAPRREAPASCSIRKCWVISAAMTSNSPERTPQLIAGGSSRRWPRRPSPRPRAFKRPALQAGRHASLNVRHVADARAALSPTS